MREDRGAEMRRDGRLIVADVAGHGSRGNMPAYLARRGNTVTGVAGTRSDGTVVSACRFPGSGTVAGVTRSVGGHMPAWFAGGGDTVTTGALTRGNDSGVVVVNNSWFPGIDAVAFVTR